MISVHFQGIPFKITVVQIYDPTTDAEEAEVEWFYEDLKGLLEGTLKKMSFSSQGIGVPKSRYTWSYKQVWLWSTKWSRAKADSFVKRIHWSQQNPFSNNTIDNSTNGQYWNQIDYILCSQRWRGSIQSAKTSPGADCGSDHQLCIAKFRLELKKVEKTTRPFRYGLN